MNERIMAVLDRKNQLIRTTYELTKAIYCVLYISVVRFQRHIEAIAFIRSNEF